MGNKSVDICRINNIEKKMCVEKMTRMGLFSNCDKPQNPNPRHWDANENETKLQISDKEETNDKWIIKLW